MRTKLLLVLLATLPSVASAAISAPPNLVALTHESDLIVVGTVTSVDMGDDTTVLLESQNRVPGKQMLASFSIDQVIKGSLGSAGIEIQYELPINDPRYGSLVENKFSILFLREDGGVYKFTNAYRPAVPAVLGARATGADPLTRVLTMISEGLQTSPNDQTKLALLALLEGIDHPVAIDALYSASNDVDQQIRFIAIGFLLQLGQDDVLPTAVTALANVALDPLFHGYLRYGIRMGIRSEAAVSVLAQLLQFPEADTRRAAAYALRQIGSPMVVQPLKSVLDDSDFRVRLSAVQGLASAFEDPSLLPSYGSFQNNEQRFIAPLRAMELPSGGR